MNYQKRKCTLEPVQIKIFTLTISITENSRTYARKTFAWQSNWTRCHDTSVENEMFAAYPQMEPLVSDMHTRFLRLHEKYKLHPKFLIKKETKLWFICGEHDIRQYYFLFCYFAGRGSNCFILVVLNDMVNIVLWIYFRKRKVTQAKRGRLRNNKRKDKVSYAVHLVFNEKETFILHFSH